MRASEPKIALTPLRVAVLFALGSGIAGSLCLKAAAAKAPPVPEEERQLLFGEEPIRER
jgi:hypothetical protein